MTFTMPCIDYKGTEKLECVKQLKMKCIGTYKGTELAQCLHDGMLGGAPRGVQSIVRTVTKTMVKQKVQMTGKGRMHNLRQLQEMVQKRNLELKGKKAWKKPIPVSSPSASSASSSSSTSSH